MFVFLKLFYLFKYLFIQSLCCEQDVTQGQFFFLKQSMASLNSEFSFSLTGCLIKTKELTLP